MTQPLDQNGPGAPARISRLGPSLSLLGLSLWGVTIAVYLILRPNAAIPGEPIARGDALQFVVVFVLGAIGIFLASIVSAVGLFLSLSERRLHRGRRGTRGVVLGVIGVAALVLVVAEILRLAFSTT